MPPKRFYREDESDGSSEDSSEATTESTDEEEESSEEEQPVVRRDGSGAGRAPAPAGGAPGGRAIANNPHDLEFDAEEGEHRRTPPGNSGAPAAGGNRPGGAPAPAPAAGGAGRGNGQVLQNNPNDESYLVDDDRHVHTPPGGANRGGSGGGAPQQQPAAAAAGGGNVQKKSSNLQKGMLKNDSHDEFEDVEDDMPEEATPPRRTSNSNMQRQPPAPMQQQQFNASQGFNPNSSNLVQNQHHDEEIDVSGDSHSQVTASPSSTAQSSPQSVKKLPPQQGGPQQQGGQPQHLQQLPAGGKMPAMKPDDDSEETSSSSGEDDDHQPKMGQSSQPAKSAASLQYNPDDYAHINNKVSREVRDLFAHITAYQAVTQELPSKLIPFIPDYLPSVGDIDTFCKVPRPDGKPDNFGLVVVDEPCANQSNPAVVKMSLQYTSKQQSHATFVDSVEDAQNRPQVIDKWITDIKRLHTQKPLPTVNYSKPMPDIESLLQIWPQEFEDMLNSDVQFPPPQIDLDIDQYVRVMCAMLDIPTYTNLIESLHVMFTLYLEFRANQHFQHA